MEKTSLVKGYHEAPVSAQKNVLPNTGFRTFCSRGYAYRVRAYNGTGASAYSNTASATPPSDTTPPTTMATNSPAANSNGWNNTDVTVDLTATDDATESGVKQIGFSLSGAQAGAGLVSGNTASVIVSAEGPPFLLFSPGTTPGTRSRREPSQSGSTKPRQSLPDFRLQVAAFGRRITP